MLVEAIALRLRRHHSVPGVSYGFRPG
jgi:hypothetical protein